jgi:hypothetical protein
MDHPPGDLLARVTFSPGPLGEEMSATTRLRIERD